MQSKDRTRLPLACCYRKRLRDNQAFGDKRQQQRMELVQPAVEEALHYPVSKRHVINRASSPRLTQSQRVPVIGLRLCVLVFPNNVEPGDKGPLGATPPSESKSTPLPS